ncbi:hypothetical protein Hanom_Chr02g00144511 [Helianthus anomalus]
MEHVAQELNSLDPSFASGQPSDGPTNSYNLGVSPGPQLSVALWECLAQETNLWDLPVLQMPCHRHQIHF